jgi:hypothetical protein
VLCVVCFISTICIVVFADKVCIVCIVCICFVHIFFLVVTSTGVCDSLYLFFIVVFVVCFFIVIHF